MTSGGMSSFPGALLQARELMALLSSSTEGGMSSSSTIGKVQVLSTTESVTVFSPCVEFLVVFCQPHHLFASVCDNVTGGGLEGCNLGGTWTEGFLHAIRHGTNVAAVSRVLNTLTKAQPTFIGTASRNLLGIIPGFPECSK